MFKSGRHNILSALMWICMLGVIALVAARLILASHASGSLIPELVSFVPVAILPAVIILILAVLWGRRVLAPTATLCLLVLLYWHAGYLIPNFNGTSNAATAGASEDTAVRVMTLNTLNGHASAEEVVACVREQGVEVLALQEVTSSFLGELAGAGIYDVLPYYVFSKAGQWDNGGINCLFTATEMTNQNSDLLPMVMSSISAGNIIVNGKSIRLVTTHPNSPHKGGESLWSQGLTTIASLGSYSNSYVIMGDFNSTWNHALFRQLLGSTFVDASERAGEGFHMTYPANSLLPALIEIDHIIYTADAGISASDLATVEIAGTDHYALLATLTVE